MICDYCQDPILKFQKRVTRPDREGKNRHYHKGCYSIILDEIIEACRLSMKQR